MRVCACVCVLLLLCVLIWLAYKRRRLFDLINNLYRTMHAHREQVQLVPQ
eukprot:COSAG06_NODE_28643_length_570_cov_1.768577_1_plen_49_part_01